MFTVLFFSIVLRNFFNLWKRSELYGWHFFHRMELHDKHFLSNRDCMTSVDVNFQSIAKKSVLRLEKIS